MDGEDGPEEMKQINNRRRAKVMKVKNFSEKLFLSYLFLACRFQPTVPLGHE
jgi:hypothetical protein